MTVTFCVAERVANIVARCVTRRAFFNELGVICVTKGVTKIVAYELMNTRNPRRRTPGKNEKPMEKITASIINNFVEVAFDEVGHAILGKGGCDF